MSFTDVNAHTKKIISDKQYRSMGKFSVTTPEKTVMDLEKTFSMDGAVSVLGEEKKYKLNNKESFVEKREKPKSLNQSGLDINTKTSEINISASALASDEKTEIVSVPAISAEAAQLINALLHTQNHIVHELTDVFDKRLEKLDDIIVDLIRCKTENERLKQKIDNLTRDNYRLKKDTECYKAVVPGLYIKRELDRTKF